MTLPSCTSQYAVFLTPRSSATFLMADLSFGLPVSFAPSERVEAPTGKPVGERSATATSERSGSALVAITPSSSWPDSSHLSANEARPTKADRTGACFPRAQRERPGATVRACAKRKSPAARRRRRASIKRVQSRQASSRAKRPVAPRVPTSSVLLAVEPRVRALAGLVPRVRRKVRAVPTREAHQHVLLEDELLAGVIGRGVDAGVHANGVTRARLDAEAAEDAAQLVDHEAQREALVAAARIAFRVLARFDMDALRRARGRATQTSDAARRTVVTLSEPVHAARSRRVRALLLGIRDAVDAVFDAFGYRIVALTEDHFFRVLKEMFHRNAEALGDLWDVSLDRCGAIGTRDRDAGDLLGAQSFRLIAHADIRALRVPPAAAANCADDEAKDLRLCTGLAKNTMK